METQMRFLLYARVSPKGSSFSARETTIGDQLERGRDYVRYRRGIIAHEYADELCSGDLEKLPSLQEIKMQLDTDTADDWDAIVVYRADRLLRSHLQFIQFCDLLRQRGKGLVAISEGIDTTTHNGRFLLNLMSVLAENERELTRARTRDKMRAIAAHGGWPSGKCPYGYRRARRNDNHLVPHERKAAIVREIFYRFLRGESMAELSRTPSYKLNATQISRILYNPVYTGKLPYDGEVYEGKHDPLISDIDWRAAQERLPQDRNGPRISAQLYAYLLTGRFYCYCGARMTTYSAWGRSNGEHKRYHYYACRARRQGKCKQRMLRADEVDEYIVGHVSAMGVHREDVDAMVEQSRRNRDRVFAASDPDIESTRVSLRAANDKLAEIEALFIRGVVNAENSAHWNARLSDIRADIDRLKTRLDDIRTMRDAAASMIIEPEELAKELNYYAEQFEKAQDDAEAKRALISAHIQRIDLRPDGGYTLTYNTGKSIHNKLATPCVASLTGLEVGVPAAPVSASTRFARGNKHAMTHGRYVGLRSAGGHWRSRQGENA